MHESPTKTSRAQANLMINKVTSHSRKMRDTPAAIVTPFSDRGSDVGPTRPLGAWGMASHRSSELAVVETQDPVVGAGMGEPPFHGASDTPRSLRYDWEGTQGCCRHKDLWEIGMESPQPQGSPSRLPSFPRETSGVGVHTPSSPAGLEVPETRTFGSPLPPF